MKKNIFLFLFLATFSGNVIAQDIDFISVEYVEIINYSLEITYADNGSYKYFEPSFGFYGNALATKQAKFDHNYDLVNAVYGKLVHLELINKANKATLKSYKEKIKSEVELKSGNVDWSYRSNADSWLEYISEPFKIESIKKEINLLQKCQNEISRLKIADPDGYPLSKRYSSISKVLEKLATCLPEDIGKLNWESIEIEENAKNKSKTSDNSNSKGYVTSAKLNVRSGASTSSGIITSLSKGDELEIIEVVNEKWTKVKVKYYDKYSNSYSTSDGYVFSSFISSSNPSKEYDYKNLYEVIE